MRVGRYGFVVGKETIYFFPMGSDGCLFVQE